MEAILECFFESFSQLERNTLHARYKRRATVEYFNTLIEGCSRGEGSDPQKTCREAIMSILRYHDHTRKNNGNVCMMGKYHNILYVAVKLCHDWQLKETATVATLLDHIFLCEKTFERIWVGAIFGTKAPHFIAGWKSDFDSQEDNLRAAVYFLDHATNAGLEYCCGCDETLSRFIDVPIECCGKSTALKIAVQLGLPDKLHILLRFGALVIPHGEETESVVESLLMRLNEFPRKYPYNLVDCLQFLLRVLTHISIDVPETYVPGSNIQRDAILLKYLNLVEDGIIPTTRCGIQPPELKHLCRCSIRYRLWENYQLPSGIRCLPVPDGVQRYLDLLED